MKAWNSELPISYTMRVVFAAARLELDIRADGRGPVQLGRVGDRIVVDVDVDVEVARKVRKKCGVVVGNAGAARWQRREQREARQRGSRP